VKLVGRSFDECRVRRVAAPPVAGITNTSKLPYRSDAKAILEESGDHTGMKSWAACTVS